MARMSLPLSSKINRQSNPNPAGMPGDNSHAALFMTPPKNTEKEDVRLGFTSASNAEPDTLCPGRHLAQRGLAGYESRDATSGQLVHAAFAGLLEESGLSSSQRKTVERGRKIEDWVVDNWFTKIGHALNTSTETHRAEVSKRAHRELRLWAYKNGQKVHSGAIDALWLAGDMKFALIEDLKSLFGDVDDAASNQQLRDYAALVHLNYGCEEVSVFINQPNVRWGFDEQKLVTYSDKHLKQAVKEMNARVKASHDISSPRIPGLKQCAYCLACGTDRCPESLARIKSFTKLEKETWEYWSPVQRADFIELAKSSEKLAETALKVAKEHIKADPKWATGWQVTADMQVRSVEDVTGVANALVEAFGDKTPAEHIMKLLADNCKVSVGDLETIHGILSNADTAEDRRAEFNVLFGDLIKKTTRAGSLKKAK
jgi:hypothetical protein